MIAYKVVMPWNDKLVSVMAGGTARVEYKIGEICRPVMRDSFLFVFKELKDAKSFVGNFEMLFECEVPHLTPLDRIGDYHNYGKMLSFWHDIKMKHGGALYDKAPTGTYVTPWVRLIQRVS